MDGLLDCAPPTFKAFRAVLESDTTTLKRFQLHNLGHGSFSEGVFAVKSRSKGMIAVKVGLLEHKELFLREAEMLKAAGEHPNIIGLLHKVMLTSRYCYLVLEFVRGADLLDFFAERTPPLPQRVHDRKQSTYFMAGRRHIARSVLLGLQHLHQRGIVHGDAKMENIMIAASTFSRVTEKTAVKLIDLGLAHRADDTERASCGSLDYAANEKFLHHPSGFAGDVFAYSVILFAIMYGMLPFRVRGDELDLYNRVVQKHKGMRKFVVDCDAELLKYTEVKTVILLASRLDPAERKTCTELLQQPLFTSDTLTDSMAGL